MELHIRPLKPLNQNEAINNTRYGFQRYVKAKKKQSYPIYLTDALSKTPQKQNKKQEMDEIGSKPPTVPLYPAEHTILAFELCCRMALPSRKGTCLVFKTT